MSNGDGGSNGGGKWGLPKISFWLLAVTAILYLVSMILHLCNLDDVIVKGIQAGAAAIFIAVVAYIAGKYVFALEKSRTKIAFIVLYAVSLTAAVTSIVITVAL